MWNNYVHLDGRLAKDVTVKKVGDGMSVCNFSIAVNRKRSKEDEVDFFDVAAWGNNADYLGTYGKKGAIIHLDGTLRQDRFTKNGENRTKVVVSLDTCLVEKKAVKEEYIEEEYEEEEE